MRMDKKTVANFRKRINKSNASDSVMGNIGLISNIDVMSHAERVELQMALQFSKSPISCPYLDKKIKDFNQRMTRQEVNTDLLVKEAVWKS